MNKVERKTIKFYSNKTSTSEYVKLKLEDQIERRGLPVEIKEIFNMKEITDKGIKGLPAIVINDKCLELSNNDPIGLANKTMKQLLKSLKQAPRINIVIPTDFSSASMNAISYGIMMAKQLKADIKLLHIQRVEYAEDLQFESDSTITAATQDLLNDELEKARQQVSTENIQVSAEMHTGFAGEKILETSTTTPNAIIIMGTSGNSGRLKRYIGSVSTDVATKSKVPVLLVPPSYTAKPISNILYCAKEEQLDIAVIDQFLEIVNVNEADISIINMSNKRRYDKRGYLDILSAKYPKNKISYTSIEEPAKYGSVNNYAKEISAEMIVVSTKHRDRLSKLFHNSFSFELAVHTNLPLLILHKN